MKYLLSLLMLITSFNLQADSLIMARVAQSFPEAMLALQDAIREHGYTVTRVQRVDIGLTSSGYNTDKYRVVFFAKPQEQRELVNKHPKIIAYLPLKFNIFAENNETLINTLDPTALQQVLSDKEFAILTTRWKSDVMSILEDVRKSSN